MPKSMRITRLKGHWIKILKLTQTERLGFRNNLLAIMSENTYKQANNEIEVASPLMHCGAY